MGACQDCWVQLESGERLRACTTPLVPGMPGQAALLLLLATLTPGHLRRRPAGPGTAPATF